MRGLQSCLLRLLLVLLGFAVLFSCGGIALLYQLKADAPEIFDETAVQLLGVKNAAFVYELSEQEQAAAQAAELDEELVARASAVEAWADAQFGEGAGDRSIYIALTQGESANCSNAGRCLAAQEMRRLGSTTQLQAFLKLVEIWERNDIRSHPGSRSAAYIPEDYNPEGILGSCDAGALGCSQFMAGTVIQHLELIGEPFDLWDPDTAMMVMAAELHRLGWQKDANIFTKIRVLLGWNNAPSWVTTIVNTAQQILTYLGERTGLAIKGRLGEAEWWQTALGTGLEMLGLYPEIKPQSARPAAAGGLITVSVESGDWQLPVANPVLSSNAQDHTARRAEPAWDLTVPLGTAIYPARPGTVAGASCDNAGGYGCYVYVNHGDGFVTRYAHMIQGSIRVRAGDKVGIETILGEVGWTGKTSFGPHVHFVILQGGQHLDPIEIFGQPEDIGLRYEKFANAR